jgi:4'-phosphopantetheinyl transferase EntD
VGLCGPPDEIRMMPLGVKHIDNDREALFAGLLDSSAKVAQTSLAIDRYEQLFAGEENCVADAVPARRREFLAGRACARSAMTQLGLIPGPLPHAADRTVVWPADIVGSITHGGEYCAAAVARKDRALAAVGIDLEPAEALPRELLDKVLRPEERAWIDALDADRRGLYARVIFSIKECTFKCQYPVTRRQFEFRDMSVIVDCEEGFFHVAFPQEVASSRRLSPARGRLRIARGHIACAMTMPAVDLIRLA